MRNYEKPMILTNEELAEGVYAASGDTASTGATYSLKETNAWDGNKQYDITFTNLSDEKVDSVTVNARAIGTVTSIGGNVSGTVNGSVATITFNNYGNGIAANATVTTYMAITGTGEFSLA